MSLPNCHTNYSQYSSQTPCARLEEPAKSSLSYQKTGVIYLNHCEVPLAQSLQRHETGVPLSPKFNDFSYALPMPTSSPGSQPPSPSSRASPISPRAHIPRPPNAFMIYRSELIKNRTIPLAVEHRQQNISRLAGECWNLLPAEEKEKYHKKAAEVLLEHQRLNPNYKFTPAPRGSRRSKAKGQAEAVTEDSRRIRDIREQYTKVLGPSLVATRRRKRKAAKDRSSESDEASYPPWGLEINPGLTFSGLSSPSSPSSPMTIGSDDYPGSFFSPPSFPQVSLPRRPSTSLGFSSPSPVLHEQTFNPFINFARPFSNEGLSTVLQGLDMAASGMHDAAPNTQFHFQPLPPFNFDVYSLSGSMPVNYNPFIGHDSSDILNVPYGQSTVSSEMCINSQQFTLNWRDSCELSPLDTMVSLQQQSSPAYDGWPMVNNPSDDINYAVDHRAFNNATLPPISFPASQ